MIETCDTALQEAARIINVIRERGVSTVGEQAVLDWSDATASRGSQRPHPRLGLALMRELRLVSENADGDLAFHAQLGPKNGGPAQHIERFPGDVTSIVLQRVMGVPELRTEIARVLVYCAVAPQEGRVEWRFVPRKVRTNPAWLWLQRIGSAVQTTSGLLLDRSLLPFIVDIREPAIPLSQADLDARLLLQRERADLAEELVVRLERARLSGAGADYLAEAVVRVSLDDVCAGYDVQSFEISGEPRLIEVKCSAGPRELFFLSDNERAVAEANGDAYWLAWVGWGINLPDGDLDICWVRNLARVLRMTPSPWQIASSGSVVRAMTDDAAFKCSP